jgi:hypothetical protein
MAPKKEIKSLKNLSIELLYQDLIRNLLPLAGNVMSGYDINQQPSSKKPKLNHQHNDVTDTVKEVLNEYLIGGLSRFRQKLANNFLKYYRLFGSKFQNSLDIFIPNADLFSLYLGCVLDQNVKELVIPWLDYNSASSSYAQIIEKVGQISPNLKTLKWKCEWNSLTPLMSAQSALGAFKNLTVLELKWETSHSTLDFFTHLGTVCSQLKIVNLIRLEFNIPHLLALMFGPKQYLLPSSIKEQVLGPDNKLHQFQFTPASLTPICQNLVKFSSGQKSSYTNYCLWGNHSAVAFILRHFPKLRLCSTECCHIGCPFQQEYDLHQAPNPCHAVALLHRLTALSEAGQDLPVVVDIIRNSLSLGSIQWTENEPFTGNVMQ